MATIQDVFEFAERMGFSEDDIFDALRELERLSADASLMREIHKEKELLRCEVERLNKELAEVNHAA